MAVSAHLRLEPELADAWFNIGRILDLQGLPDSSAEPYQRGVALSPRNSRYRNNLADLSFRLNDYENALKEYGEVKEFPLAALEAANILRLQGTRTWHARGSWKRSDGSGTHAFGRRKRKEPGHFL